MEVTYKRWAIEVSPGLFATDEKSGEVVVHRREYEAEQRVTQMLPIHPGARVVRVNVLVRISRVEDGPMRVK